MDKIIIKCTCESLVEVELNNKCNEEGEEYHEWVLECSNCDLYKEGSDWGECHPKDFRLNLKE